MSLVQAGPKLIGPEGDEYHRAAEKAMATFKIAGGGHKKATQRTIDFLAEHGVVKANPMASGP